MERMEQMASLAADVLREELVNDVMPFWLFHLSAGYPAEP